MLFKKCHIIALGSPQSTENNEFLLKMSLQCIGLTNLLRAINHATEDLQQRLLVLQIWFVRSTMPWRIYSEDYWFSKYGLYSQPCHWGFTVKITDSPNMVCTVNHATEDLQWRLLILQIWVVRSTMPRRIYSEDYWFSKYGLFGQPCYGGFTA